MTVAELQALCDALDAAIAERTPAANDAEWYVLMAARRFVGARLFAARFPRVTP